MSIASYFQRSAVAASQVLSGFDEPAIRRRLESKTIGIEWDTEAIQGREGQALLELSVRLLARLYPRLSLRGPDSQSLAELAQRISAELEVTAEAPDLALVVGKGHGDGAADNVFVGSDRWDAFISTSAPQRLGTSSNPAGAAAAACIGAANLFRAVFVDSPQLDADVVLSTLDVEARPSQENVDVEGLELTGSTVLVGAGAIGNAAAWLLANLAPAGTLHLVDHEDLELSNLQRYVLAEEADVGRSKVDLLGPYFTSYLVGVRHAVRWDEFTASMGYDWDRVLVALDTAADRRAVQASLPRWIANGWTQPGDLGVSTHPWDKGACLSCLYLPEGEIPNEDALISAALGLDDDAHRMQIRGLLHANSSPPRQLLEETAAALEIEVSSILPYENRPLRDLYTEGICGGALLALDRVGRPDQAVHVPLAHQSALAGVLLASRLVAAELGRVADSAVVSRLDLLRPVPEQLTQPMAKDRRHLCICQDAVYQAAYDEKYQREGSVEPRKGTTGR